MWNRYQVKIQAHRLTAGIPANEKMLQAWLEAHQAPLAAADQQTEMLARLDVESVHGVVFYRDASGTPCLEGRCLKASLKESANILKGMLEKKAYKSKLAERVFVEEELIPLAGDTLTSERPISVMTMQGPRTSIKRYEYMLDVPMEYHIRILDDGVITADDVRALLEYGQMNGIGADRSQGSGQYDLLSFTPV